MKTCFKCGQKKPVDEFYRHPAMGDGYLGKCKECTRRDTRENRAKRLDYYRRYDRDRFQTKERRDYCMKRMAKWKSDKPEKYRAHYMVKNAIRDGKLIPRPCERCGDPQAQAHHTDYSKPLDVLWLCFTCHRIEHGQFKDKAS